MNLDDLMLGFSVALTTTNILFCLFGVTVGTLIGLLPGLGPASAMALLLPLTMSVDPAAGIIMLAGVYYGSKYGGALTAILVNLPGESASVVTMIDGHPLAKMGRGGPAAGVAAMSSFVGGTIAVVGIMLIAPPLASFALRFGPPEYFALAILGLTTVTLLAGKSRLKTLIMVVFGLLLSTVGSDISGATRLTLGHPELWNGLSFTVVAVGLFGIGEILVSTERRMSRPLLAFPKRPRDYLPSRDDVRRVVPTWLRAGPLSFVVGILPGAGSTVAAYLAYGLERTASRDRKQFGKGDMRGVAAAETADNAGAGGNLIPMLSLGIPDGATTAILLSAFIMFGLKPGPFLITDNPEIVWGLIASMYVGNVLLLLLNLPLAPLLVQALRAPYSVLYPTIAAIAVAGVYSVDNSMFDVLLLFVFGAIGWGCRRLDLPLAPAILAFALGHLVEQSLRQSLVISRNDIGIFVERPLTVTVLVLALVIVLLPVGRALVRKVHRRPKDSVGVG